MSLINKISESIMIAMKEKNTVSLESLRAIKSSLLLAQTQKGANSEISEEDEIKILQKLVKQRKESATFLSNCIRSFELRIICSSSTFFLTVKPLKGSKEIIIIHMV